MKLLSILFFLVLTATLIVTGCVEIDSGSSHQTMKSGSLSEQAKLTEKENLLEDATGAIAALKKKVGGDKVMATKLTISPTSIEMQVQDQKKKENVDAYKYKNGSVSGPFPVKLYGGSKKTSQKTITANTFNLDECDFTKVPFMVTGTQERLQLEGGKVMNISLRRNLPFSDEVLFMVFVSGTRRNGSVTYDQKGKMKKIGY